MNFPTKSFFCFNIAASCDSHVKGSGEICLLLSLTMKDREPSTWMSGPPPLAQGECIHPRPTGVGYTAWTRLSGPPRITATAPADVELASLRLAPGELFRKWLIFTLSPSSAAHPLHRQKSASVSRLGGLGCRQRSAPPAVPSVADGISRRFTNTCQLRLPSGSSPAHL